jgi:hypothetical protein
MFFVVSDHAFATVLPRELVKLFDRIQILREARRLELWINFAQIVAREVLRSSTQRSWAKRAICKSAYVVVEDVGQNIALNLPFKEIIRRLIDVKRGRGTEYLDSWGEKLLTPIARIRPAARPIDDSC